MVAKGMTSKEKKAIKKIRSYGVNNVHIRPQYKGWAILHQTDMFHATQIFEGTEEECHELVQLAAKSRD